MIHILKSPARIDVNCSWFTGCKNSLHISCREPHISSPKKNNTRRIIFLKIKKKQLDLSIIRAIYRRLAKSYFTYEGKQHYPRTNLTYHTINHKRGKIAVSQAMKKMPVRIGCRDKPPQHQKQLIYCTSGNERVSRKGFQGVQGQWWCSVITYEFIWWNFGVVMEMSSGLKFVRSTTLFARSLSGYFSDGSIRLIVFKFTYRGA